MPVATVDRAAIDLPQSVWHARSQSGFPQKSLERANSILLRPAGDDTDDIDLETAMANARENLALGKSPGAGLESAFDQADAAYADLIVTSVDDQGITLDAQIDDLKIIRRFDWDFDVDQASQFLSDVEDLAKGGMMDEKETSRRSKGLFGDVADLFGALSGGAHIVKREDGTL